MLDNIIKIVLKWIASFSWSDTWEKCVDDEVEKLGGRCWNEETHPILNRDGTWKKSTVTQIPVSFGKLEWGDVEKDVPLIECIDAVVDELVFNKRARKLFLLLLIENFKHNSSPVKDGTKYWAVDDEDELEYNSNPIGGEYHGDDNGW